MPLKLYSSFNGFFRISVHFQQFYHGNPQYRYFCRTADDKCKNLIGTALAVNICQLITKFAEIFISVVVNADFVYCFSKSVTVKGSTVIVKVYRVDYRNYGKDTKVNKIKFNIILGKMHYSGHSKVACENYSKN